MGVSALKARKYCEKYFALSQKESLAQGAKEKKRKALLALSVKREQLVYDCSRGSCFYPSAMTLAAACRRV